MVDFTERHSIPERMDHPGCSRGEFFRVLDELNVINDWFGGYVVSMKGIQSLVPKHAEGIKLLDVGCGGGELSRHLYRWTKRKHINLHYIGVDINPYAIDYAKEKNPPHDHIEFVCEDVLNLRKESSIDVVHAGLCLHHFYKHEAVKVLRKMYDLSVYGVVINDLHRHPLSYFMMRSLTSLGSRSEIMRHDAPASVLNAFNLYEMYDLADKAGIPRPAVTWHWAFRWLMIIPKKSEVKQQEHVLQPELAATKTI